ncbi:EcoAI/FtnUII family type I restriction enzme subunit R [Roseivirga sp. BDSF3-8]|uniref:EcoAI/FtnUII family type I restriction enzme subunit R n=1 Tax=Roseivirga sp. BDSF3-8 TaxID=3241598 RepID=UPI003531DF93
MNEQETRSNLIYPRLVEAGWKETDGSIIREEIHITKGRLIGNGRREKPKIADYILRYRNRDLAVVEAKARSKHYTEGLMQAKEYADRLNTPYAYATNGEEIYEVNMQEGREGDVAAFPGPQELWERIYGPDEPAPLSVADWKDRLHAVPFEAYGERWQLRYYQQNAISAVINAIAEGQQRILLTLATGTGKTAISFQIIWKLFQARWNLNRDGQRTPRVLFLADRNILANQAYIAFSAFEEEALCRIRPSELRKKGKVPTNRSIFFTIFQTFMSGEEDSPWYTEYDPDFFDFIVIDECHRGGARDESRWREVMEHFEPAVQLGMTATPKRDVNADTYDYFGEPVYVYSLKEGINDGFLTPFRVKKFTTQLDEYQFEPDDVVLDGEIDPKRLYREEDFNRIIEIKEREKYRVQLLMEHLDQRQKTIVFCATQEHAAAVRDLINQMKTLSNDVRYCVRVTANDGDQGEKYLRDFQNDEKHIPTILTTSQKLSTGVDAPEVRNIVLLRKVNSMVEFKQIVGRGTRLYDNKDYFTIYDFVKAYEHFNDPEWDGEPDAPEPPAPGGDGPREPKPYPQPEPPGSAGDDGGDSGYRKRTKVKLADGKYRHLQHMASTSFYEPDTGRLLSAQEFLERLFGDLPGLFTNEQELRRIWSKPDTRRQLLQELEEKGYGHDQLRELQKLTDAEDCDLYDVLSYVAFTADKIKRSTRADKARIHLQEYDPAQQEFLNFVLQQYVEVGVEELDQQKLQSLLKLKYRAIANAKAALGPPATIKRTFDDFQQFLYAG